MGYETTGDRSREPQVEYYLDLFEKSLDIESTISMKTLLRDKRAHINPSVAQNASKLTLEELCVRSDSLTDENNQKLAVTFLLMDGYISDYTKILIV